jgi:hypothetical protein
MYDTFNPTTAVLGNTFVGIADASWLVNLLPVLYNHVPAKPSKLGPKRV